MSSSSSSMPQMTPGMMLDAMMQAQRQQQQQEAPAPSSPAKRVIRITEEQPSDTVIREVPRAVPTEVEVVREVPKEVIREVIKEVIREVRMGGGLRHGGFATYESIALLALASTE